MSTIKVMDLDFVQLNCPCVYADPEFQAWLNRDSGTSTTATWHIRGQRTCEFSDIFMFVDGHEGSDSDMPEHCWEYILACLKQLFPGLHENDINAFVWLTNLEGHRVFPEDTDCGHIPFTPSGPPPAPVPATTIAAVEPTVYRRRRIAWIVPSDPSTHADS